jgi:hypothetical protein
MALTGRDSVTKIDRIGSAPTRDCDSRGSNQPYTLAKSASPWICLPCWQQGGGVSGEDVGWALGLISKASRLLGSHGSFIMGAARQASLASGSRFYHLTSQWTVVQAPLV